MASTFFLAVALASASVVSSTLISSLPTTAIQPTSTTDITEATGIAIPLAHTLINRPLGASLLCLNCSTSGILDVSASDFDFQGNLLDIDATLDGQFHAEATGMSGYAGLELQGQSLEHSFILAQLPTPLGFGGEQLLGGVVGVFLQFEIDVALRSKEPANMTFGFNFTVPDGAFIDINLIDLSKSAAQGFVPSEGLQVDALPIRANVSVADLDFSAAFRTSLLYGFSFADNKVYANAGAFFELPRLVVREREIDDCPDLDSHSNAIKVVPEAEVNIGLVLQAGLEPLGKGFSEQDQTTLASLDCPLQTTCVADGAPMTLTLGPMSAAETAISSSVAGSSAAAVSYATSTTTTDVDSITVTATDEGYAVATVTDVAYTTMYTTSVTTTSCT